MTFNQYIIDEMKKARMKNINEVRENIKKDWVQEKIINHCERFDGLFSPNDVMSEIMNSDIVASCFAKDPLKQNLAEKKCEEWISIKKLPASGKNCIRFTPEGTITNVKGSEAGVSKSADFFKDGIYYTQKYTGENSGGAQDNQYEDVVTFLKNGSISHKVGAIVDGFYWENLGNKDKLKKLFENNSNVSIVSADDLHQE